MSDYKSYVGPKKAYESTGLEVFGLLKELGLKPKHRFLDMGCGGLRVGKHIILYLDQSNYHGVEPEVSILENAICGELTGSLLQEKRPTFSHSSKFEVDAGKKFDFVLAYDVFYHCGKEQLFEFLAKAHSFTTINCKIYVSVMYADGKPHQTIKGDYNYRHASHSNVYFEPDEFLSLVESLGYSARQVNFNQKFFGSRMIFELRRNVKIF